jgi:hypothetical protein
MTKLNKITDLTDCNELGLSAVASPLSQKALSIAEAIQRREEREALTSGIDGYAEMLNALVDREESRAMSAEQGYTVSDEQAPVWFRACNWVGGRVIGFDGLPVDASAAVAWRVQKALEEIAVSRPERVEPLKRKLANRAGLLKAAQDRVDAAGEAATLPYGFLDLYVSAIEKRIDYLKRATFKPVLELEADIVILEGELART